MPDQDSPETQRRILDAARAVFVRRGTAGARMQEIAEEAGVNQALLHYYFRSKDGLAGAVFTEVAGRLFPNLTAILGSGTSLEEKVERFVGLYIDTVRAHPFIPGYIVSELHHHPERIPQLLTRLGVDPRAHVGALLARLGAQIDERVAAGTMRPIAPRQFILHVLGLTLFPFVARPMVCFAFALDAEGFDQFVTERRAEIPVLVFRGLRP